MMKKGMTAEEARRIGEKTWLHFYNQVLHNQGLISDEQFIRMKNRIDIQRFSAVE